jgi:hypothetical protein
MNAPEAGKRIESDKECAKSIDIQATPTIFINGS